MHPLVKLAKDTVEQYARQGTAPEPHAQEDMPDDFIPDEFMDNDAGVFVSLKINGELRGCIGTFRPTTKSIAEETVRNAIAASTEDPRFPAIDESELEVLTYSVDVLGSPEPVADMASELDPKKYGVIVTSGGRRGLLLPDLEGVDTMQEQLRIAMMKAGIAEDVEAVDIERFVVKRYR